MRYSAAITFLFMVLPAVGGEDPSTVAEGRAHLRAGKLEEAIAVFRRITVATPKNAVGWYLLGYGLHRAGRHDEALRAHERAASFPRVAESACYNAACVHALKGRNDEALRWLEKAWGAGFRDLDSARRDSDLARLRRDPRFARLLVKLTAELEPFRDGTRVLHEFRGAGRGDQFGWVAANAGDLNRDGANDVVISAVSCKVQGVSRGRIYVYSGKTGTELLRATGEPGDQLGYSVDSAGDCDGDGCPDIVAGAPAAGGRRPGRVRVYSGKDGHQLLELRGAEPGDLFGTVVREVGDIDGDARGELIVGAPGHARGRGRVYLYSGKRLLATLDGEHPGARFGSAAAGAFKAKAGLVVVGAPGGGARRKGVVRLFRGESLRPAGRLDADATGVALGEMFVSLPGDCDGDGNVDVLVSDWRNAAGGAAATGRAYLLCGRRGILMATLTGEAGEGFGIGRANAGDCDGDGCDDLLLGAWKSDRGAPGAGCVYVYSGRTRLVLRAITCRTAGDSFGFDTTGLGDVNGDGNPDFLITSAWSGVRGPRSGRAFIIAGNSRPGKK